MCIFLFTKLQFKFKVSENRIFNKFQAHENKGI